MHYGNAVHFSFIYKTPLIQPLRKVVSYTVGGKTLFVIAPGSVEYMLQVSDHHGWKWHDVSHS